MNQVTLWKRIAVLVAFLSLTGATATATAFADDAQAALGSAACCYQA
jgi:hypothetical protein